LASSEGKTLPQVSPTETESPLRCIFRLVAGTDAQILAILEEEFDTYDDITALAVDESEALTNEVVSKLPLAKHKSRLRAILKYISIGGGWKADISLGDVNDFNIKSTAVAPLVSSATATSADSGSKMEVEVGVASAPKLDAAPTSLPIAPPSLSNQIEGGKDWTVVDRLLEGLEIRVNIAQLEYATGVERSIIDRLEERLGAQLNKSKSLSSRPLYDGTGRSELNFQLRCKGYCAPKKGEEKCPFTVSVATMLDEEGELSLLCSESTLANWIFTSSLLPSRSVATTTQPKPQ